MVDVIYVENAAYAHELVLAQMGPQAKVGGKAYFLGQERPVVFWDFLAKLLQVAQLPPLPKFSVPTPLAYGVGTCLETLYKTCRIHSHWPPLTRFMAMQMTKDHYFSHQRALQDFGYRPLLSIEESLLVMERELKQIPC